MSDATIASSTLIGAALPVAAKLISSAGAALIESGVDPVKMGWMQNAAAQIQCNPEIDRTLASTARFRNLWVSPTASALLAPVPKILLDGLLEDQAGRTLVAMVSLWSLVLEDTEEISSRLHRYAKAIVRNLILPPPSEREVLACCLPAFAADLHEQVNELHNSLITHEQACVALHSPKATVNNPVDLAGEFAAAVASCSRQPDTWVEAVNCVGITDTIVTLAHVTGFLVAVTIDGVPLPVTDVRPSSESIAHQPQIVVKYNTSLEGYSISVCSETSPDVLVSRNSMRTARSEPQESYVRLSVLERNAVARLTQASEDQVKLAVEQCFGIALSEIAELRNPTRCRNNWHHLIHQTLIQIDRASIRIDGASLIEYMSRVEPGKYEFLPLRGDYPDDIPETTTSLRDLI